MTELVGMMTETDIAALDASDPLAHCSDRFQLPPGKVYLNGNSLGPLPKNAVQRTRDTVEQQWGDDLVSSWNRHHWIDLPVAAGEKIAPLLGAAPGQVVCCDSISVNLFKLLGQCLALRPGRRVVLSQQDNFPTDLYVAQGLSDLVENERCELRTVAANGLLGALDNTVAVLMLTQVNFRDGSVHDIAELTRAAHDAGALVIWDLAHSAGVLPLELDHWQVDFAVGCGYKYLNGGPGAPAFIYASRRHLDAADNGSSSLPGPFLQGWMGHKAPFEFNPDFVPASGMASYLTGTPPILSLAVLDAALDQFADVDMAQLHCKSLALSRLFMTLVAASPTLSGLTLLTPDADIRRGGQLAYAHEQAYGVCQALAAKGVIADFRSPDVLRLGFSPLFLRFDDIAKAVKHLVDIIAGKTYQAPDFNRRNKVT
jgi:kynureninase